MQTTEKTRKTPRTGAAAHFGIREAREKISKLVSDVENSGSLTITLGRRDKPSVILASFERLKPLLSPKLKDRIAFLIVENLLKGAPLHSRNPQIKELASSKMEDLILLLQIDRLPLNKAKMKALESQLEDSDILSRLLKRRKIADAINKAEEEGLYEAAEHFAGQVAPEPSDE
jgi:hypothetical protein